jgi:hypothetical protein
LKVGFDALPCLVPGAEEGPQTFVSVVDGSPGDLADGTMGHVDLDLRVVEGEDCSSVTAG